jgi:hypothetical protein
MDMKKILQAMDGVSTKPVEGAGTMARFLRVVKEAEINQPEGLPAVTPIKVPAIPQLPAQDGEFEGSGIVRTNPDGTRTYSTGMGTFTYDTQGKAITYATPQMMGLGQSINLANNQTTRKYNSGPIATSQRVDANGKPLQTKINYDIGTAKMGYDNDHVSGIRSAEFTPHPDMPPELFKPKDMYARGNKDREATYDRAMAQVNGATVQESSLRKFLSIVDKNNVSMLSEGPKDGPAYKYQLTALQQLLTTETEPWKQNLTKWRIANLQQDGVTAFKMDYSKDARGVFIPNKVVDSNAWVKANPNLLKRLPRECQPPMAIREGANPHRVALPVQMAMQHYQQPATKPQPRERLIDKYFVEAETAIIQRTEEKRALYNQYAKTIANRVLMKESAQGMAEDSDPNKLAASVTVDGEFKEFDLTPLIAKNNWVGTPKQIINLADTYLGDFFRKRGSAYSNLKLTYKGMTLNANQVGDVGSPDPEFESIAEAPIAMDPAEPNNPTIHNHQKANTMSLKGRIASARAQLQELAELSESNSLLAWEQICKKAKGGMFMGLEQNLEQIRHGIEELAKQRRKGGTASRGIDKHIGEGKRK